MVKEGKLNLGIIRIVFTRKCKRRLEKGEFASRYCFNYKKGGGGWEVLSGRTQESKVQIYGEHLHILSLFETLMSKHIASVAWTVFFKLKKLTS